MSQPPVVVSLPIADRRASFAFFAEGLGFETVGEIAQDGVPEPLQLALGEGVRIMLVPTGGFGWITGGREVAPRGSSECVITVGTETDLQVDDLVGRAVAAGGTVVGPAGRQPWGYVGTFADLDGHVWMVRSEAAPT